MSSTIKCNYCHEEIPSEHFQEHIEEHKQLREDGQQNEYLTLPEEERIQNVPIDTPTIYKHSTCNQMTGMPDEIVASYLKNPFLYMADETYCAGCQKHVKISECEWVETEENVKQYMDNLRKQNPHLKPNLWQRFVQYLLSPS